MTRSFGYADERIKSRRGRGRGAFDARPTPEREPGAGGSRGGEPIAAVGRRGLPGAAPTWDRSSWFSRRRRGASPTPRARRRA